MQSEIPYNKHSIDWKLLLKENGIHMYSKSKYIGEKDQMRLDHDPLPNESI